MKYILQFVLVMMVGAAFGQQQSLYSNYMINNFVNNPALAGIEDYIDTKFSFRRQWINVNGSPITSYASVHGAINQGDLNKDELGSLPMRGASTIRFKTVVPKKMRHGLGGFFMNDRLANLNRNAFYAGYAAHLPLNQKWYLALGANLGAAFYNLNTGNIDLRTKDDPAFANRNISTIPDLNFGLYLYSDKLQIGLAGNQLVGNKLSFRSDGVSGFDANLTRHFYGTATYRIPIDLDFDFLPNTMVRYTTNGAPLSVDAGAKFRYRNTFWAGVNYRYLSDVVGLVGFNLYKFIDLSYAFDFNTSKIATNSTGTHEIVVGLRLNNKKPNIAPKIW